MKKLVLLLVCLVFAWSDENSTPTIQWEEASKEICGDEPWECVGIKYFIANSNLEQAYQLLFESAIRGMKENSKENGKKVEQNLKFLLYQQIIALPLPKDNESLEKTIFIKKKNNRDDEVEYKVEVELTKSKNKLVLIYTVETEDNEIIFIKTPEGVEILDKTSAG